MVLYGNALKSTTKNANELIKLTGSLTLEQTKNVLTLKKLDEETVKNVLSSRDLTDAQIQSTAVTIANTGANATATTVVGAYTAALWANAKAMAAAILTNPVTWILGVVAAIGLATKAYKAANPTIEEQKKKLEELKDAHVTLKDELTSLSDEITRNNEKIVELQNKLNNNTITLVEEDELNKLRLENSLLQQQLTIKEDLEKLKHKEVVDKSVETFSNEFGDYKEPKELSNPNDVSDRYLLYMEDYKEIDNQSLLLLIKENKKRLKNAMFSGDEELSDWMQEDQENLEVLLNERLLALNEYQTDLSKVRNSDGTFDDESYQHAWDEIEKWKKDFYDTSNRSGEWNTIQIEAAINTESLRSAQEELRQKLVDGELTEKDIESYTELNDALKNSNLIITNGQSPLSVYMDYLHGTSSAQAELNTAIENMPDLSFEEVLKQLEESHTSLTDLKKEINETKVISVDTIQDLMGKYPSLTNLLSDYVEGKADEKDVVEALSDEYATDLENYRLYIIQKHGDDEEFYDEVVDNLSEDLIAKANSYGIELGNYSSYLEAKLAMDKEYARKKAILESAKDIYEDSLTDPAYRFNPSISAYDNMMDAEQAVADIEEIINSVDTSIQTVVPDFNKDLFKKPDTGNDTKKFSDSIDWAANSISNLEAEIARLNETIANTDDIDKKIDLLEKLKEKQKNLETLKGNAVETYKGEYDETLEQLTPAERKKYQPLIESTTAFNIKDFKGEKEEKLFNKLTASQSAYQKYQQAVTDHETAKQNVKDTKKQIKDVDTLERSQQTQEKLESQLDLVDEKLNDSTLTTKERNTLLAEQLRLQMAINEELAKQAEYNGDKKGAAALRNKNENLKQQSESDTLQGYIDENDSLIESYEKQLENNNLTKEQKDNLNFSIQALKDKNFQYQFQQMRTKLKEGVWEHYIQTLKEGYDEEKMDDDKFIKKHLKEISEYFNFTGMESLYYDYVNSGEDFEDTNYETDEEYRSYKINKNDNDIKDIQNKIALNGGIGTEQDYETMKNLHKSNRTEWEEQKLAAEAMRDSYTEGTKDWNDWNNKVQECDDNINSCNSSIKECNQSILKLPLNDIDLKLMSIQNQLDDINEIIEYNNQYISAANYILDKEIRGHNKAKELIQDQLDALEKMNNVRKTNLALQQAEYNLRKATEQRSSKVFVGNGQGWQYQADEDAIRSAQEQYDQAIYDNKVATLNEEIRVHDEEIKLLNRIKDEWSWITTEAQGTVDVNKALIYDLEFEQKVLSGNASLVKTISDNMKTYYADKTMYEDQQKRYEKLQDIINDTSTEYELGAIGYEEARAKISNAIKTYYPEVFAKYGEESQKVQEIIDVQLEKANVTEETSEDINETVKESNEKLVEDYGQLVKDLEDVFKQLNDMLSTYATNAQNMATSVASSILAIKNALDGTIGGTGSGKKSNATKPTTIPKNITQMVGNAIAENAKGVGKSHSGMELGYIGEGNVSNNKKAFQYIALNKLGNDEIMRILQKGEGVLTESQIQNVMSNFGKLAEFKAPTLLPLTKSSNQSVSFTGDIVINNPVGDTNSLAHAIRTQLPNAILQELYK